MVRLRSPAGGMRGAAKIGGRLVPLGGVSLGGGRETGSGLGVYRARCVRKGRAVRGGVCEERALVRCGEAGVCRVKAGL